MALYFSLIYRESGLKVLSALGKAWHLGCMMLKQRSPIVSVRAFMSFYWPGKVIGISCTLPPSALNAALKKLWEETQWPAQGLAWRLGRQQCTFSPTSATCPCVTVLTGYWTSLKPPFSHLKLTLIMAVLSRYWQLSFWIGVIQPSNNPDRSVAFGKLEGTSKGFLGH